MKKIVPSTPCRVEIAMRRGNVVRRIDGYNTKFGYIRERVNAEIAAYNAGYDQIQSIEIKITIGA